MGEILKSAGHRVCFCDRLEQCVDKLADVDMVLTDIQLGGFSGYQLLSAIRSASEDWARRLPVIAVSASDRLEKELSLIHISKSAEGFRIGTFMYRIRARKK